MVGLNPITRIVHESYRHAQRFHEQFGLTYFLFTPPPGWQFHKHLKYIMKYQCWPDFSLESRLVLQVSDLQRDFERGTCRTGCHLAGNVPVLVVRLAIALMFIRFGLQIEIKPASPA